MEIQTDRLTMATKLLFKGCNTTSKRQGGPRYEKKGPEMLVRLDLIN